MKWIFGLLVVAILIIIILSKYDQKLTQRH